MTGFEERKKAFENKFAHDEEVMFKMRARRNRIFGEWVADQIGKTGEDREIYLQDVVRSNLAEPGDADIISKIKADLAEAAAFATDHEINTELESAFEQAVSEFQAE